MPSNGEWPVSISCKSTPRAHQSAALERPLPSTTSGGAYWSVPHFENERASLCRSSPHKLATTDATVACCRGTSMIFLARPKSQSLT